jgi:hypothetical protein
MRRLWQAAVVPDHRLFTADGRDVDGMRAPEDKPTFVPTTDQESVDRVRDFFFEGVKLLVDGGRVWVHLCARREPSACAEQYFASAAVDDGPVAERVRDLRDGLVADDRVVLGRRCEVTTPTLLAETDVTEPPSFDPDAFERRLDRAGETDRPVRVAAPGLSAAYRGFVHWADRVDGAVVADDTEGMVSGEYHLAVEPGHDEWGLLGSLS